MWVEVVKSIALKPTRSITGPIVRVFAVSTPTAAQVLWLPSRSEVSTRAISATLRLRCNTQQHLPVLDRRSILHENLDDPAARFGAHGVHELHHLDDADDRVVLHLRADLDKGRRPGLRRAVENSDQRRSDVDVRGIRGGARVCTAWLRAHPR